MYVKHGYLVLKDHWDSRRVWDFVDFTRDVKSKVKYGLPWRRRLQHESVAHRSFSNRLMLPIFGQFSIFHVDLFTGTLL